MVNTGQPSDACIQCRARRVKCDASRPQCKRCTKYGVLCPGYPEKGLVFRDDTDSIRERALKKYEKKKRRMRERTNSPAVRPMQTASSDHSSMVLRPILSSVKTLTPERVAPPPLVQHDGPMLIEAAVDAFLSQWSNPNVDLWWGVLDPTMIRASKLDRRRSLGCALQAVSLMTLALRPEARTLDLRRSAAKLYGQALQSINQAIQDPEESREDDTLIAVTLVAMFESMHDVLHDGTLPSTHIKGMMSMIDARGPDQFQTLAGRRIFLYTYFIWSTSAMPDMAVMHHMSSTLLPPLSQSVIDALLQYDFSNHEPPFRLLPLIHRSVVLRATSLPLLPTFTRSDTIPIHTLLTTIRTLDTTLRIWNSTLPAGWGCQDRLYEMLTTSWYRTHRIFLADLTIRCSQLLAEFQNSNHDATIWAAVDIAQNAIDEICVRIPYTFGTDDPGRRKPHIEPRTIPDAKVNYLYHASFEYPLLVSSMVWTLPPFRQRGIEAARRQCANACGLTLPWRVYPKVLVYITPEERARYLRYRIERHRRWVANNTAEREGGVGVGQGHSCGGSCDECAGTHQGGSGGRIVLVPHLGLKGDENANNDS